MDVDFSQLGLTPQILAVVQAKGFTKPTPIQLQAIPIAVTGKDVIGIAQTGTGKTLAFGLPLIQRILNNNSRALIVVPTRELALQVDESLRNIGRGLGIRTAVIIGGAPMHRQTIDLRNQPHIIIGTPGRIIDHLERRSLNLNTINALVLDEADRMLDMGFAPQINRILEVTPRQRQTLLFSATMPSNIMRIAERHMQIPLRIEIAPTGTTAERVTQEMFMIDKMRKQQLLDRLLAESDGSTLVFTRTKHGAKKLTKSIRDMGHKAVEIHGNRTLAQRREALDGFKDGRYRVLVATDIAARGIDVTGIQLVVNYDIPESPEDYVHRIGRTGRAGLPGRAVTFIQPDQRHKLRDIERLVRTSLSITPLPELPPQRDQFHTPPGEEVEQPHYQGNARRPVHRSWGRHRSQGQQRYSR